MSLQLQNPSLQQKQPHVSRGHNIGFATSNPPGVTPVTLDLFHTQQSLPPLEFLDTKTTKQKRSLEAEDHQSVETVIMSNSTTPKLDLRLNLSSPRVNRWSEPGNRSDSVSPPSSCVSSEANSPEVNSMVLVGCPRCLMYVMLSEDDPKCPKCKSNVLLDFLPNNNKNNNNNNHDNNNNRGGSKKTRKN